MDGSGGEGGYHRVLLKEVVGRTNIVLLMCCGDGEIVETYFDESEVRSSGKQEFH